MHITTAPARQLLEVDTEVDADTDAVGNRTEGRAADGAPSTPEQVDLRGVVVVGVEGDVDLYTGPDLRQALVDLLSPPVEVPYGRGAGGDGMAACPLSVGASPGAGDLPVPVRAVIVDLTEVEFIDSYAVGILVQGHHLARRCGAAYALVATHPMIHKLFVVTGLAKVLPLHPDVAAAVAGLHPAVPSPAPGGPRTSGH